MGDIAARKVRVAEVATASPSPFARSLLFGYVGMFLYETDAPLAERRAAALSLDSTLLAELLGSEAIRELLDPEVVAEVEAVAAAARAGPARPRRRGRGGPAAVPRAAVHRRGGRPRRRAGVARRAGGGAAGDPGAHRAARSGGLAIEDAGRVRDALGVAAARRRARDVHRAGAGSAGRPAAAPRPHARAVPRGRGGGPVRPRGRRGLRRAGPAGRDRPAGPRRAAARRARHRAPATAPSTATPRCCGGCGAPRWPGCGPRSSRWSSGRWAGSCRRGRACRSPPVAGAGGCGARPASTTSWGWSSSWPGPRCRRARSSRSSCPHGCPATPPRCWTS